MVTFEAVNENFTRRFGDDRIEKNYLHGRTERLGRSKIWMTGAGKIPIRVMLLDYRSPRSAKPARSSA